MKYLSYCLRLVVYILIIFSFLFMTNNKIIGSLCARHICAILLLFYAVLHKKRITIDKYEKHFFIFVCIYIIASIINSEFFRAYYIPNFISYYFSAFVLILGIPTIISTKDQLYTFMYAIFITFVLNSALTLFQFLNFDWAWELGTMSNAGLLREMETNSWLFESGNTTGFIGRTITAGFTGFVVTNGYFTTCYFPTALFACEKLRNRRLWMIFTITLCVLTTFVNQQRSGFFFVILFIIFYLIFLYKDKIKSYLLFPIILFAVIYLPSFLQAIDFGRLLDFQDSTRDSISNNFYSFITTVDSFFGGMSVYTEQYGIMQHNSIKGAWVISGFWGFLCYLILYLRLCIRLLKKVYLHVFYSKYTLLEVLLSISCLLYLAYSLTHASGLHNDGMMFWLTYSLLLTYERLDTRNNLKINEKNTFICR